VAQKIPPHNNEAEQAILGSLLIEQNSWDQVSDVLVADDFYRPHHNKIFSVIKDLHSKSEPVDLITLTNYLQTKGELDLVGGAAYLVELVNKTISSANIQYYAKIVKSKSTLRKLIFESSKLIERAYAEEFQELDVFLDEAEMAYYKLNEGQQTSGLVGSMDIVKSSILRIEELYKNKSEITGVPTGFTQLDKMTSGLQPGNFIIIAARPSMGKTAFSLNLVQHMIANPKLTIAYFSLEMGKEDVMMRLLASEASINLKDVRAGKIDDSAWPKLIAGASKLSESKLFIDDSAAISPFEVRSKCRRLKAQHGLDIILIDYLQMMDLKQRVESRERAVSEISRTLKGLAKELKIPVVALAQLNRGVEGRSDRRPMLSDLRESGSIEQDADVIMMLYREDYYDRESAEKQGLAEVIIGKQRNGPTGTVKLKWEASFGRFKDADPEGWAPPPPPPQPTYGNFNRPKNFAPGSG
jgi:replicative DNA helicase